MTQEAKSVNSIYELVQDCKADTGIMLGLHGVRLEKRGTLDFVLTDDNNGVRCFGQKELDLEGLSAQNEIPNQDKIPKYDVTGTWHGNYFSVYQINLIN